MLGGKGTSSSTEWLEAGTQTWKTGPDLGIQFQWGCTIKISDTEVLLIGGFYTKKNIFKLDVNTNNLTSIGELQEERVGHACAIIDKNIVISGGENSNSTEIISLNDLQKSKLAGNLNQHRAYHKLIVSNINNKPTLLAIGGSYVEDEIWKFRDSIEVWNPITESWSLSDTLKLSEAKCCFGALSVPTSLICPP